MIWGDPECISWKDCSCTLETGWCPGFLTLRIGFCSIFSKCERQLRCSQEGPRHSGIQDHHAGTEPRPHVGGGRLSYGIALRLLQTRGHTYAPHLLYLLGVQGKPLPPVLDFTDLPRWKVRPGTSGTRLSFQVAPSRG